MEYKSATSDAPLFAIRNQQNNYMQVNSVVMTGEQIKNLP